MKLSKISYYHCILKHPVFMNKVTELLSQPRSLEHGCPFKNEAFLVYITQVNNGESADDDMEVDG